MSSGPRHWRSQNSMRCARLRRVPNGNSFFGEGLDMIGLYLGVGERGEWVNKRVTAITQYPYGG